MKFKINFEEHLAKGAYNSYGYIANSIHHDDSKMIEKSETLSEALDWEIDAEKKDGIIVFSTDVNAVKLDTNKIINWIKQKAHTIVNRIAYNKKIDKIAKKKDEVYAWTVGKYLHGRYKAKDGQVFDENSISVEFLGVDTDTLLQLADEICREFEQETVLVKDIANNRILFRNGREE